MTYSDEHRDRMDQTLAVIDRFVKDGMMIGNIGVSDLDDSISRKLARAEVYAIVPTEDYLTKFSHILAGRKTLVIDITRPDQMPRMTFDVIILSEVLEHLFAEDEIVLKNVHNLLSDNGLILLTVPNAATLRHRLRLLIGRNVFWPKGKILRGVYGGHGHIREYTFREVLELMKVNFRILQVEGINGYRRGWARVFNILPKSFSNTILVVAEKLCLRKND